MSVLFITIGLRDVQYVFEDVKNQNQYVRMGTVGYHQKGNKTKPVDLDKELITISDITREIQRADESSYLQSTPVGVCFPMLEKTLTKIKPMARGLNTIFLVSTDRSPMLPKIKPMKNILEKRNFQSAIQYIEDDILYHVKKDNSAIFGQRIKQEFSNTTWLFKYNKINIFHLRIGEKASYLSSFSKEAVNKCRNEKQVIDLIAKADINRSEFFYPECFHALQPHFDKLKDQTIYLSISGGMPGMQRTLETIFTSLHIGHETILINVPEQDDKRIIEKTVKIDYTKYFALFRRFKMAMNIFHFNQGISYFNEMASFLDKTSKPYKKIEGQINALETGDNFKLLYAKILSAFYREDFIGLCIFLKSIQEQTCKKLLQNYCSRVSNAAEYVPYNQDNNLGSDYIQIDGNKYKVFRNEIFAKTEIRNNDENISKYTSLMLKENNLYHFKNKFHQINMIRNQFLHNGFVEHSQLDGIKKTIYNFLNLDPNYKTIKRNVLNNQITKEVTDFEKNLTGDGSFIQQTAQLLGKASHFTFDVRGQTQNILETLGQCPLSVE